MPTEDVKTAPVRRVFISLPKKHIDTLSELYPLDHGLFISELNSYINEAYLRAYFYELGFKTECKIKKPHSGKNKAVAFVRFPTQDEADRGDWAGPHCIGGTEVKTRRIVSPKIEGELEEEMKVVSAKPPPRRPMGLGYMLGDS